MVYDLVDPHDPQGRTWKQINAELTHQIPLGSLVELTSGVRLFVAYLGRDCDMTPLYWLTADSAWIGGDPESPYVRTYWNGGYSEESLKVIKVF